MKASLLALLCAGALAACVAGRAADAPASFVPADYAGKPYADEKYTAGPQAIPGMLQLAYYDLGGEGVAYHDTDPVNHGGGELNTDPYHQRPASSAYYWAFRKTDGMDTSYTKDFADFGHPNLFTPEVNQLYLGWTGDGEWCNYTVDVKAAGTYKVIALYSNQPNAVTLAVDRKPASTCTMPVATEDWHHWNKAEVGAITFDKAGLHLLTFSYNAGNNFAYLEFVPTTAAPAAAAPRHRMRIFGMSIFGFSW